MTNDVNNSDDLPKEWQDEVIVEKEDGLITLNFSEYGDKLTDDHVHQLLTTIDSNKKVNIIDLNRCNLITDKSLKDIGQHCHQLNGLNVSGCVNVTDKGIRTVLITNPKLMLLRISGSSHLTVASIDVVIEYCSDIRDLLVVGLGLSALPDNIGDLKKLEYLYLQDNNITTLPVSIGDLNSLKALDLRNNKITTLPVSIGDLDNQCSLRFQGNPLQQPPLAIAKQGPERVRHYYAELNKGATKSNKLKVVLIGNGEAGKTTTLRLIEGCHQDPRTGGLLDRTIHLDLKNVKVEQGGGKGGEPLTLEPLTLVFYDCGGQKEYLMGQTPFITESALYLLIINADEEDNQNFLRFIVLLQARAPRAVVQIILTKPDQAKIDPKKKAEEVLKTIQDEVEKWKKYGGRNTIRVQEEVIISTVWEATPQELKKTREQIVSKIFDLTDDEKETPLLHAARQVIPLSWSQVERFIDGVRELGYKEENRDELFALLDKQDNKVEQDALSSDEEQVDQPEAADDEKNGNIGFMIKVIEIVAAFALFALSWYISTLESTCSSKITGCNNVSYIDPVWLNVCVVDPQSTILDDCTPSRTLQMMTLSGMGLFLIGHVLLLSFDSKPNQDQKVNDNEDKTCVCPYLKKETLLSVWGEYRNHLKAGSEANSSNSHCTSLFDDVLTLLEGQGSIYIYADLIFLDPSYVSKVMKPLSNHHYTLRSLDSEVGELKPDKLNVKSAIDTFIKEYPAKELNEYANMETLLKPFLRSGKLTGGNLDEDNMLLRFLWRDVKELEPTDYAKIIDMLRNSGMIIDSYFDSPKEGQSGATKKHPIVLFRLPSERPSVEELQRAWPEKCPNGKTHFELRIRMRAGCPPSLSATFAANVHSFGTCWQAWINGAIVVAEDNNTKICAELMKGGANSSEDCVRFAVRSEFSPDLDVYLKHLLSLTYAFMKDHKKRFLPGLQYDLLWTCPTCIKTSHHEVSTFPWDPDNSNSTKEEFCDHCHKNVSLIDMQTMVISNDDNSAILLKDGIDLLRIMNDKITAMALQVNEIPDLVLKMETIKYPYLFKFISEPQYKTFLSTNIDQVASNIPVLGIMAKIEEGGKVLEAINEGVESLLSLKEVKIKRFSQKIWSKFVNKKRKKIYLQLLDGRTFLPVVSYEIEVTEHSKNVMKFAKFGADMVAIGIKASIVWNIGGKIAFAFGIPVPSLKTEELEKIQSFLKKVNKKSTESKYQSINKEGGGVKSDVELNAFGDYLDQLDAGGNMCHLLDEVDHAKLKETKPDRKWNDGLEKEIVMLETGKKVVTWISIGSKVTGYQYGSNGVA